MKFLLYVLFLFVLPRIAIGQQDSTELQEVIVTGIKNSSAKATALNVESYKLRELENKSPLNLSDALAKIPGISQMSIGNAISKPVIRGLYGHRILVLLSGLRFDNQQWQDEHGLGLSQLGIDRVEVIKGAASVLYGTDAIGGVVNIIEETPQLQGTHLGINTRLYSNTLGTLTDAGISHLKGNTWWRLRLGYESHGDYSDGSNTRVLNSRNGGYYTKAGFGFTRKNWTQNNSYNFSYNQYGFILPDLPNYFKPDARWSRSFKGPHHNVMFNTFSSQNTFALKTSVLKINAGVQSNKRAEDEGGGEISLNMHLLSLLQNAKWEKQLGSKALLVINEQFTYETNRNLGKRKLVPDANMVEGNLSAFLHFDLNKLNVEAGAGCNYKQMKTFKTKGINDGNSNVPDPSISPFLKGRSAANAMIGFSYNPTPAINIKSNISTGNRMANLAELSSNGLHEGVYRYEVGNPEFKMEQNTTVDLTVEIDKKKWFVNASAYYNRFFNYIYLAPTGKLFQGLYYEYRFRQQNAMLYGAEFTGILRPKEAIQIREVFTMTEGLLDEPPSADSSRYLPFIPAYRSITSAKLEIKLNRTLRSVYAEPEVEYVFAQNHPAVFETSTADYMLLNVHAGGVINVNNTDLRISLSCRNLLNKAYADHLSRLKYYGINNTGINIILSLSTDLKL